MGYNIVITEEAQDDLKNLDKQTQIRILKKMEYFKELQDVNSVAKRLTNFNLGEFRFRVGDYRIVFDLHKDDISINRIQHRKDIYRNL